MRDESASALGFSPSTITALFVAFGVACLAGLSITGMLLDRFPQAAPATAVATQAVGMLGLYAADADPVASVVFLVLTGGALGPVFMTTQNAMLHCAPGRTDMALAANSGAYNAGVATGAALGELVLPLTDVRGTFLVGGLLTLGACAVSLGGRLLPGLAQARAGRGTAHGRNNSLRPVLFAAVLCGWATDDSARCACLPAAGTPTERLSELISQVRPPPVDCFRLHHPIAHSPPKILGLAGLSRHPQQFLQLNQRGSKPRSILPVHFRMRRATEVERSPNVMEDGNIS